MNDIARKTQGGKKRHFMRVCQGVKRCFIFLSKKALVQTDYSPPLQVLVAEVSKAFFL